ncbi:MAG: hypothetical protein WBA46_10060 [Thermomicrobiales bacterium]
MPTFGPHPIFDAFPHIGWETGPSDAEKVYFVFVRNDAKPVDWQGGRTIISDRIPGGPRSLTMDLGAKPLLLETSLLFADAATFQKFWRLCDRPGLLRMNADWTVWPGRAPTPVPIVGRDYVEFPGVVVVSLPSRVTFDVYGAVHCDVTFQREDTSWSV